MTRTIRSSKPPGHDWWSRRPYSNKAPTGSRSTHWWKRQVHKAERQQGKHLTATVDDG